MLVKILIVAICLTGVLSKQTYASSMKNIDAASFFSKRQTKQPIKQLETPSAKLFLDQTSVVAAAYAPDTSDHRTALIKGVLCVIGGVLAHLALGTLYCWANFNSYSPPSLRFYDGLSHPGKQADSFIVIPLTMFAQCLTLPLGPLLCSKIGASYTLLLGSWIMAVGVFLSSFAKTLQTFLFFYALVFGAGIGLAYTAPMVAGFKWLPHSKGLVSGGVLAGFGMGGFFFNLLGTKLVNPKGLNPVDGVFPEAVYAAFPAMLRTLAVVYAALSLLGALLVSEPPEKALSKAISSNVKENIVPTKTAAVGSNGITLKEALLTNQFWLMWFMIITSASAGLNVATGYKQFASNYPSLSGDSYQALVGGLGALFNGFGRLFWGLMLDKIGFKNCFLLLTVLQTALQFTYPYSSAAKSFFLGSTCVSYFCLAGTFALMPPAAQKLFGPSSGATIYGMLYSAFAVAAIGGQQFAKAIRPLMGWEGVFRTFSAVSFFATLLSLFLTPLAGQRYSTV